MAPSIIEPTVQKSSGDCVIASIAMVLGLPYVEVSKFAETIKPDPRESGITIREAQQIAKKLVGHPFQSINPKATEIDLESDTGILWLRLGRDYHAVVLFEGVVYNPADGLIWNLHTYLATKKAHVIRLLRP